jgi:ubiquitin C-terminal hydrolase
MGTSSLKKNNIFRYYIFQKKFKNYLTGKISDKERKKIKNGYLIPLDWIKEWKRKINYNIISKNLDSLQIESTKLKENQINEIKNIFQNNINNFDNNMLNNIIINNNFIINERILSEKFLESFVNEKTYKLLKIDRKIGVEEIKYIFKQKMMILFLENYNMIKILFSYDDPMIKEIKLINITFIFDYIDVYYALQKLFRDETSDNILIYLSQKINIISQPKYKYFDKTINKYTFTAINEEKNIINNFENNKIKNPNMINFNLVNIPSYRGLENVGATCYMNATLQCLANIKPITDYLLNKKNYEFLYKNGILCNMTLHYSQVLLGLFCNESNNGYYSPKDFKDEIGEYNPLFKGVQANDSKDLIIFLLEILNNELVKIYNKKRNIVENRNDNDSELYQKIDASNEKAVLDYFVKEFKKNYCSVIGQYLFGFNKSLFVCQSCGGKIFNFNLFNNLIFNLEATSNYYNLSYNNSTIPIINFDFCFKYMIKEEVFQSTYCQHCGLTGLSKYRETIYSLPLYLIIILNRGRGNIFNCNVQIPEIFDASNYIEIKSENNNYELVGIVSHFGESGMGGHFIAFCKHSIDGKWRCYNDSVVTECQNDYLNKGVPYILFYKKCQIEKIDFDIMLKSQEIYNDKNNLYNNQNINPNFCNNNMFANNISNNINFNQNMNVINNNNYYQPNMMMNNINNYNQNYINNNPQQNIYNNANYNMNNNYYNNYNQNIPVNNQQNINMNMIMNPQNM